ncbi:MAG: NUDIX hydrolase [Chloroflexi bacterium]|nr:NUDIX hydrolase [Chloroflexota bacterium]
MSVPRAANFCPLCGARLEQRRRDGALRPVCPACGHTVYFDPKVAVVVLVMQADRVLLVKRANEPKKGFWTLPGGFVDAGEDPRAAASREVEEETALLVQINRLLDVFHTPDDGGLADIVIAYDAGVTGGAALAADDAEAVAWFGRDDLPPLAFLPTERLVHAWAAGEF